MPITLSDLRRNERKIEVEWEGETMGLTYCPGAYTPELEALFVKNLRNDLPGNAYAEVLSELIVDWEFLDDEGLEMPHDIETLKRITTAFLTYLFTQITNDMQAAREDRKNSGGGSARRATLGNARSGTR